MSKCLTALFGVCLMAWIHPADAHRVHNHADDNAPHQHQPANSDHGDPSEEHTDDVADRVLQPQQQRAEHFRRFRESGDDRHLDQAAHLLPTDLDNADATITDLVDAARLAQTQHRFSDAKVLLRRALAKHTTNDEAWLLLATTHMVQGDSEEASHACKQLANLPALAILTCHARARLVADDPSRAIALSRILTAQHEHVLDHSLGSELLAWSLSVAGDGLFEANLEHAATFYARSLLVAENAQTRAALFDALLELGRLQDAAAVVADRNALPLIVRQLIVAKRMDAIARVATLIDDTDRTFQRWIDADDLMHAREMARFYLDVMPRHDLARRLATENIKRQREPEDRRLVARLSGDAS